MAGEEQESSSDAAVARAMTEPLLRATERARRQLAKELQAHARAIRRHEQAAAVQDRFGRPERARAARQHAEHARQLRDRALQEQRRFEQRVNQWLLRLPAK